jgi:adenylate cyclase
MSETRIIAGILVAKVVGYSRLAEADENGILERPRACAPICSLPPSPGITAASSSAPAPAFLSSFAAQSTSCVARWGEAWHGRGLPPERHIEFRIGIRLGDVVEEADRGGVKCSEIARPSAIFL